MIEEFENFVCIRHKYLDQMARTPCPDCVREQERIDEELLMLDLAIKAMEEEE